MKFKVTLEIELADENGYNAPFTDYEKEKIERTLSTIDYDNALYGCIDDTLDGVAVTKCITLEKLELCK